MWANFAGGVKASVFERILLQDKKNHLRDFIWFQFDRWMISFKITSDTRLEYKYEGSVHWRSSSSHLAHELLNPIWDNQTNLAVSKVALGSDIQGDFRWWMKGKWSPEHWSQASFGSDWLLEYSAHDSVASEPSSKLTLDIIIHGNCPGRVEVFFQLSRINLWIPNGICSTIETQDQNLWSQTIYKGPDQAHELIV